MKNHNKKSAEFRGWRILKVKMKQDIDKMLSCKYVHGNVLDHIYELEYCLGMQTDVFLLYF